MPRPIDGDGNGAADCDLGSVEYVDLTPPLASFVSAPDVNAPGADLYFLQVTYSELDSEIDLLSIGVSDITISPGPLSVQSTALSGSESELTVTYTIVPPGGAWDPADNGVYTVMLNPGEVLDTATTGANAIAEGTLGSFDVVISEGPTEELIFSDGFETP